METGKLIKSNYAGVNTSEPLYYLKRFFIDYELAKKLVQDKVCLTRRGMNPVYKSDIVECSLK